ncbi:DUF397 domain-containing protein [Streptomyces sp. NPDC001262]|uniref:DUF397 domain-containing protein n=1 Tax=unclassified Streptomyces TaxID=2593676 RepID=UPI0036AFCAB7
MNAPAAWQKSSFSESEGSCVEVTRVGDTVGMRESDDPEVVIYTNGRRLANFIVGVKENRIVV